MSKGNTCGECKCYDMHGGCNKVKNTLWIHSTNIACIKFEAKNPTNGDRIRQMGNEELAELNICKQVRKEHRRIKCLTDTPHKSCRLCKLEWLNAPAESKESDGKDD